MDSVFFYHIEEDELANFKRAITQRTALIARRVFYPGPFCRHASVHFHVDVAVWFFLKQMTVLTVVYILVVAYYIIGYKQLFGYGLWGTLWRQAFVFIFVYCCALLLGHFVFFSGPTRDIQVMGFNLPAKSFMTGFYIFTGVLILSTGYLINRLVNHFVTRKTRRQDA